MDKMKVVISGTCHGDLIQGLLSKHAEYSARAETVFIPNYQTERGCFEVAPVSNLLPALQDCDMLIYHDIEKYDFPNLLKQLPKNCIPVRIPYITSTIYWPSHDIHPFMLIKRDATAYIPFPCLILNRLVETHADAEDVYQRYLDLDLSVALDMDGLYEGQLEYLRRTQSGTVFDFVKFTEDNFRTRQLFHLINHPSIEYFELIANRILGILGFAGPVSLGHDPFTISQIPVHPSVIDYYGLTWCSKQTRYNLFEKKLTFAEYVRLYIGAYAQTLA